MFSDKLKISCVSLSNLCDYKRGRKFFLVKKSVYFYKSIHMCINSYMCMIYLYACKYLYDKGNVIFLHVVAGGSTCSILCGFIR